MSKRIRLQIRRGPKRTAAFAVGVVALMALSTSCGGSDPVPRSFSNEEPNDDASPKESLPESAESRVQLSFKKGHFVVEVSSDHDFCLDGRNGAIFEKPRKGKADKVGQFKTDEVGVDNVKVKKAGGTYFATLAPGTFAKYGDVAKCGGAHSNNARV